MHIYTYTYIYIYIYISRIYFGESHDPVYSVFEKKVIDSCLIAAYQESEVKNSEKLLCKNFNESEWSLIFPSFLLAIFLHFHLKNFC